MNKLGFTTISYELLEELLKLPPDMKIREIVPSDPMKGRPRYFHIVVEGDSIPETPEGCDIPRISLTYE